jgi:hypothetical protein
LGLHLKPPLPACLSLQIGINRREADAGKAAAQADWQAPPGLGGSWANAAAAATNGGAPAPSSGTGVADPQLAQLLSGVRELCSRLEVQEQQLQQARKEVLQAQQAHPAVASYMDGQQRIVDERVEEVPELTSPTER